MSLKIEEIIKRGLILEADKNCRKCEGQGLLILQRTQFLKGLSHTKLSDYKVLCTCVKMLDLEKENV